MTTERPRRRVLFVAEAVTLAHVARPHVLARGLPASEYHVRFACDPRYDSLFGDRSFEHVPIHTVSSKAFLNALAKGSPLYDIETLDRYVQADLAVIDDFQPDVIVGDFRLSLSVSARLRKIPYIAISNAYWSPNAKIEPLVPELPLTRWLGYRIGGAVFRIFCPVGFAIHARPFNQLRERYGISKLGADVREAYVDGDIVLFADVPRLVPLSSLPSNQRFIGPIPWSPAVTLPDWWSQATEMPGPLVYVTLGSSGAAEVLPQLLNGLAELAGSVLVATACRATLESVPKNVFVADYLPGQAAAEIADMVVCNGGSPTTYQALAFGKPVLGIPSNLDQCLNIAAIRERGAGDFIRTKELGKRHSLAPARRCLERKGSEILKDLAAEIGLRQPCAEFRAAVESLVDG